MTLPDLYILRHGQTEWNAQGRYQGRLDSPLTERGRSQAVAMGAALAARGIGPHSHAAWVSPAGRAQATAALAFPDVATDAFHTLDDLCEIGMGDWSGVSRDELAGRGVMVSDMTMLDFYAAAPAGEGFDAVWDRAGRVLAALDGPTILVTHGITSRFLRARALGQGIAGVEEAEGGQGVIFHIAGGRLEKIETDFADTGGHRL